MTHQEPYRVKSISEFHKLKGLPKPEHPLISIVDYALVDKGPGSFVFDFYSISVKRGVHAKLKYGHQEYDFDEGIMYFMAPGQVLKVGQTQYGDAESSGWILQVHPDFLWNTPLAKNIKHYDFFDYSVSEALFLSDKEEAVIDGIIRNIRDEYHANIDAFSQNIIISHLEALLNYAERFYHRQFITRKIANHRILDRLETLLADYFSGDGLILNGLPTVQSVAAALHVSSKYLAGLLKVLTGMNTQQHIHEKLIEKAKEKLSTTSLSISEIAYELGFEHPQSFSKLFKSKTHQSPMEFRGRFN